MKKTKQQKRKQHKKQSKHSTTRQKTIRVLIAIFGLLLLSLIFLFFVNAGILEDPKEPERFEIQDDCSIVMGNLMHSINDEGECRLRCINNCELRDMSFERYEFELQEAACNACDCYCR